MTRTFVPLSLTLLVSSALLASGCESRQDRLERQLSYERGAEQKADPTADVPQVPADPMREAMRPLLEALYAGETLPDVLNAEIIATNPDRPYQLTAGVLAQIRLPQDLSDKAARARSTPRRSSRMKRAARPGLLPSYQRGSAQRSVGRCRC